MIIDWTIVGLCAVWFLVGIWFGRVVLMPQRYQVWTDQEIRAMRDRVSYPEEDGK